MNRRVFVVLMFLLFISILSAAEYYLKLSNVSSEQIAILTRLISIDKIEVDTVFAYANQQQLNRLKTLPYTFEIIPGPLAGFEPDMAETREQMRDWDYYPTYDTYLELMYQFAEEYPDICEVFSIGYSIEGRELLVAHIGDDINIESDEPEFYYTGQIHGDELVTSIVLMHLIDDLLALYGSVPRIDNIVNEIDLYINPLANPDGLYAGGNNTVAGATRGNANGIDMNRNYPDPEDGQHPDGNETQPEIIALIEFMAEHNFVLSADLHSGIELILYPWFTWDTLHADDNWFQNTCQTYVEAVHELSPPDYFNSCNGGILNGFLYCPISGSSVDYTNWYENMRCFGLELSEMKPLPADLLEDHYLWNYNAMLLLIEESLYGLRGIVTNEFGVPLEAKITIEDHDFDHSEVYTDPEIGDYHRPISEGTYDFTFSAWGYASQTFTINVPAQNVVFQDVDLQSVALADIEGVVIDTRTGIPLFGVNVRFVDSPFADQMTNNSGEFSFSDVPVGEHELFVYGNGFISQITDITLAAGTNFVVVNLQGTNAISFESGDFASEFDFSFEGDGEWSITSDVAYEGVYSARSQPSLIYGESALLLTIQNESQSSVSFRKKVSSHANWSYLMFYINDNLEDEWSGNIDWSEEVYTLYAGTNTLKWEFDNNTPFTSSAKCSWIDFIEIEGLPEYELVFGDIDNNNCVEAYDSALVQRYVVSRQA
ncbi:MAG: carboxypeptidase regulatory-like domain-containing protein [Candidatus Cloacimonetes bacterium]|nr:carboxypeptidase regulatory-like domain-containing protein [Candidatus Cloacimonadota bacterium]